MKHALTLFFASLAISSTWSASAYAKCATLDQQFTFLRSELVHDNSMSVTSFDPDQPVTELTYDAVMGQGLVGRALCRREMSEGLTCPTFDSATDPFHVSTSEYPYSTFPTFNQLVKVLTMQCEEREASVRN